MLASTSTLQPHSFSPSPLLPKPPKSFTPHSTNFLRINTKPHHPHLLALASQNRQDNAEIEVVNNVGRTTEEEEGEKAKRNETFLYSVMPFPLLLAAALPGASTVRSIFGPFVEIVKTLNLPDWLVHWGHPGNMAVVLFAMGGYGSYLGFRIRLSKDAEEKAKAKDLHPKLLGGMFFFFALGATGGVTALLTYDKPILESPHAVSGLLGLSLLTIQTILPALFEENPGLRTVHGLLGSSIMTLFSSMQHLASNWETNLLPTLAEKFSLPVWWPPLDPLKIRALSKISPNFGEIFEGAWILMKSLQLGLSF